jgi:hypothetical protein
MGHGVYLWEPWVPKVPEGGSKSVSATVMCFMCQLTPALPTGMANQNLGGTD